MRSLTHPDVKVEDRPHLHAVLKRALKNSKISARIGTRATGVVIKVTSLVTVRNLKKRLAGLLEGEAILLTHEADHQAALP
jgi:hypothetical protein